MLCIVDGKQINIETNKKCFDKGSEGQVYKIDNSIYKIYYPNMINEGFGNKFNHHKYMLMIDTKQIVLPESIIYDLEGNYLGYKTKYIEGDLKNKTGITKMPSQTFIKNLEVLEEDFETLTNNYVLAADVSPINYIYNKNENTMNVIDPGRYKVHTNNLISFYRKQNTAQLNYLIELLLFQDFIAYKPIGSKRKSIILKNKIKISHKDEPYSEYFKRELKNHENVDSYAKSLGKYIK